MLWHRGCGKNLYISSCFIAPFTGKQVHGYIKLLKLFESHQDESTGPLISSVDESGSKRRLGVFFQSRRNSCKANPPEDPNGHPAEGLTPFLSFQLRAGACNLIGSLNF